MKAPYWAHLCFDRDWVRCNGCRTEFWRESVSKRRKCPECKMDSHGCRKPAKEPTR